MAEGGKLILTFRSHLSWSDINKSQTTKTRIKTIKVCISSVEKLNLEDALKLCSHDNRIECVLQY